MTEHTLDAILPRKHPTDWYHRTTLALHISILQWTIPVTAFVIA